jgi:hypothetical protein
MLIAFLLSLVGIKVEGEYGTTHMPADFKGEFKDVVLPHDRIRVDGTVVPGTWTVKVYSTEERRNHHGKSSRHRTFAVCPKCGREIPTGRLAQHKGRGACKED